LAPASRIVSRVSSRSRVEPSYTIELPYDYGIAFSELIEHSEKLGRSPARPRGLFSEDPLTARLLERFELQLQVLIPGGYPRVPDLHHGYALPH
jgi:hypothetical protein